MTETREQRLAQANALLLLFNEHLRLELRKGRIWIVYSEPPSGLRRTHYTCARAAVLNSNGNSLACRYGALGMGGTEARAVAMLVRWIRDESRWGMYVWQWWCCPQVSLAGARGPELLAALEATSYPDPAKTGCVFCGSAQTVDWWSRAGDPTGPCCSHAGCETRGKK